MSNVPTLSQSQAPFVVVASAQSSSRHILLIGGIILGALLVLFLLVGFILSLMKAGGIFGRTWGDSGSSCCFRDNALITLAIGCSVLAALIISGVVAFVGLLMGVGAALARCVSRDPRTMQARELQERARCGLYLDQPAVAAKLPAGSAGQC